jgi:hypothetical protein
MTLALRIVVMLLSYSRNTGNTSLEMEMSAPGIAACKAAATRFSWVGLA